MLGLKKILGPKKFDGPKNFGFEIIFWSDHMGPYGKKHNHTGTYRTKGYPMGPYRAIQDLRGQYKP